MAAAGGDTVSAASKFATVAGSKNPKELTSKGNGKMVEDCWVPTFEKKYGIKAICDASVFPAIKEKGKQIMVLSKENMGKYLNKTAHEVAKKKCKNTKIPADDEEVQKIQAELENLLISTEPKVKQVKTSVTGGVDKMTDASQYTGAHKERFDADGKGKGADGRVDKADNSGYVGNYKGEGSYGKK